MVLIAAHVIAIDDGLVSAAAVASILVGYGLEWVRGKYVGGTSA
jgi:hypothetical protein